jgi:fibronectin-binding autotransporter adhesin
VCTADTVVAKSLTIAAYKPAANPNRFPEEKLTGTGIAGSVLTIDEGATVNLLDLTLSGGSGGSAATGAYGGFTVRGGIDNAGTLNISDVRIIGNRASAGGGIFNEGGTITGPGSASCGQNNVATSAAGGGGGIFLAGGTLTPGEMFVNGNRSAGQGGGILNDGAVMNLGGGGVSNNKPDNIFTI